MCLKNILIPQFFYFFYFSVYVRVCIKKGQIGMVAFQVTSTGWWWYWERPSGGCLVEEMAQQ